MPHRRRYRLRAAAIGVAAVVVLVIVAIGAFPVGLLRGYAERRLSAAYGAPVHVGAITRDSAFSFTPTITVRDVRIAQPAWVGAGATAAGHGDFVRLASASARIGVLSLLTGHVDPRSLRISGLAVALVRHADGTSNWAGRAHGGDGGSRLRLESLTIADSRFSLADAKRRLAIAGTIAADDRSGLMLRASGRFDGTPAQVVVTGGRVLAADDRAWPIAAWIASPALTASATGTMQGPLDTREMTLSVRAAAPSLKELDYLIEAGLFGTQPIDLAGSVRHDGHDWYVDRLAGTIGRSRLTGRASVLKRDGRTRIDATLDASQLDLGDLADNAGLAEAAALKARTGPRVVPNTRINLSHMGPTDGVIRFSAARLLAKTPSVFTAARGRLTLDHRVATIDRFTATMVSGRVTGSVRIDSNARVPQLATDLRVEGVSLDRLIGDPATIAGPARGIVRIRGGGDTIRQAFAHGSGRIAFVSAGGSVKKAIAFVLGQDLGGAIGQAIGGLLHHTSERVPLRCAVFAFSARDGVLTPDPVVIDTGVSVGRGTGRIDLADETVAMTVAGAAKRHVLLKLADPIRIGGTLSKPAVSVAQAPATGTGKPNMFRVLTRSLGSALGLRKAPPQPAPPPPIALDCPALTARALR